MGDKKALFDKISTPDELILYLDDNARLKNKKYLYHYTTLSRVIDILRSKYWYLGNAKYMNDSQEYNNGDSNRWKNIFFASFMSDAKESIAMWSMYSQPWEEGVKIAIPKKIALKWIKETTEIYKVSSITNQVTDKKVKKNHHSELRFSCVAYSNSQSLESEDSDEVLTWSNQKNKHITGVTTIPELTGYIKDKAWDYEKEVRLKAEFENVDGFERVAIKITDEVLNEIIITASPLFDGNLLEKLTKETGYEFKIEQSLFTGKLIIKSICETCPHRKK